MKKFFMAVFLIAFSFCAIAQKCDCEKIKKRNEKYGHGSYDTFLNETVYLTDTFFPFTTFKRDVIGGANATPVQRVSSIRNQMGTFLASNQEEFRYVIQLYERIISSANENPNWRSAIADVPNTLVNKDMIDYTSMKMKEVGNLGKQKFQLASKPFCLVGKHPDFFGKLCRF